MPGSVDLKITLTCLISHAELDPDAVSRQLNLTPYLSQRRGSKVLTPKGRASGDIYKAGKWAYETEVASLQLLEVELAKLVAHLSYSRDFIRDVSNKGGKVLIYISLSEPHAFALEIEPKVLGELSAMGVHLAMEVFP